MQGKLFILLGAAAATAQAGLQPRQTTLPPPTSTSASTQLSPSDASEIISCASILTEFIAAITAIPVPSDPALSNSAFDSVTDPCSFIAAVPSSLQPEVASYVSSVASVITANRDEASKASSCAPKFTQQSNIDLFLRFTECSTVNNAAATGPSKTNHAAGPRETGMLAMGAAAAAFVGVVGML